MVKRTIRAIDIGYGNTKFSRGKDERGEILCGLFPSIANPDINEQDITSGVMHQRNVFKVDVNGVTYEVGEDSAINKNKGGGKILSADYIESPQYMALTKGALKSIDEPVIDNLICGLPVAYMNKQEKLSELMEGVHKVYDDLNVTVKDVSVLAQPLGALFDYGLSEGPSRYKELKSQNALVIDVGYYTFDWLYSVKMKTDNSRSSHHEGGMSVVLSEIAKQIGKDFSLDNFKDLNFVDEALQAGNMSLFGKTYKTDEYLGLCAKFAEDAVNAMKNQIGLGYEISTIVVTGGGAFAYIDAIRKYYPNHEIKVLPDSVYSNVRGFQLAGYLKYGG